ncbi:lysine N(6)-hydroxylase/L-ornithine N(5)-oxygenase family protein [Gordonia sp. PDNC005]|uniref:lysine N(6)-hydroxylase/L-ornithine N(5)-oxygenase family protein n=1 Tax=unclassified Gordonia (in: high G+C Gram-positive bacteria) TaxID=2657482 RepID=UPI001964A4CF|nr:SidA/IucD/PvdA family monooxygenase [Gordonia sp. PDNC005]QRY64656.1 lysine N(6)-hydroxylase/L-ornithine N(5)-oxygenase family protein [Gordonia sp. PDNC005]
MRTDPSSVIDIVGIGFGPSNLGLAIAIEEHNSTAPQADRLTATFVESKHAFAWHPGMLLPGTTMQISFLKDLVTQRNTTSEFSFLSYLADRGRMAHFINHQTFFPTRREFHDYLGWAEKKVSADVRYGARATAVAEADGHLVVEATGPNGPITLNARNVVVAGGLRESLPEGVTSSARQFHNHRLLDHLDGLPSTRHNRFLVVGAGQSAAEVVEYLHDNYLDAEVHNVFAKYGYVPADDSPYANRIFDATAVDDFYSADEAQRASLLNYHRSTNYSCVDLDLIRELYRREYAEHVDGDRRLFMRGASKLVGSDETDDDVQVTIENLLTGDAETMAVDAVVYATGFTPTDLSSLLGDLVEPDQANGGVDRDYRVVTTRPISGAVYTQGGTEHTHGLTSSLLSNIAIRSGEILESVLSARAFSRTA